MNSHRDSWMIANPGKAMNIHDIPSTVTKALPLAATSQNIISGFECTGIVPFNPQIFQDLKFLPSSITDREDPNTVVLAPDENDESQLPSRADSETVDRRNESVASSSTRFEDEGNISAVSNDESGRTRASTEPENLEVLNSTLESVRPLPKAGPRKQTRRGRKHRKTAIVADSPEMKQSATEQAASKQKKEIAQTTPQLRGLGKSSATLNSAPKKRGRPRKAVTTTNVESQPLTKTGCSTGRTFRKRRSQKKQLLSESKDD